MLRLLRLNGSPGPVAVLGCAGPALVGGSGGGGGGCPQGGLGCLCVLGDFVCFGRSCVFWEVRVFGKFCVVWEVLCVLGTFVCVGRF